MIIRSEQQQKGGLKSGKISKWSMKRKFAILCQRTTKILHTPIMLIIDGSLMLGLVVLKKRVCILLGLHFSPVNLIAFYRNEFFFSLSKAFKNFLIFKHPIYYLAIYLFFYIYDLFFRFFILDDRKVWSLISAYDKWLSGHTWEETLFIFSVVVDVAAAVRSEFCIAIIKWKSHGRRLCLVLVTVISTPLPHTRQK